MWLSDVTESIPHSIILPDCVDSAEKLLLSWCPEDEVIDAYGYIDVLYLGFWIAYINVGRRERKIIENFVRNRT